MSYSGARVAITGATGFIGQHLVRALSDAGAVVRPLARPAFDLRDAVGVAAAIAQAKPDIVFHLAATGVGDLFADQAGQIAVNTLGTLAALEGARQSGAQRTVCFGSCFEYGPSSNPLDEAAPISPRNPYAASKAAAFALARHASDVLGQDIVWLRPFAVYGPDQPPAKLIPSLLRVMQNSERIAFGPGDAAWDYIHVDDVVSAAMLLGSDARAKRGVFNAGTGCVATPRQIAGELRKLTGSTAPVTWDARPARPGDPIHMASDSTRLRSLGWRPRYALPDGLRSLIAPKAAAA